MPETTTGGVHVEVELNLEGGEWNARLLYEPEGAPKFDYTHKPFPDFAKVVNNTVDSINSWARINKPDVRFNELKRRWDKLVAEAKREA